MNKILGCPAGRALAALVLFVWADPAGATEIPSGAPLAAGSREDRLEDASDSHPEPSLPTPSVPLPPASPVAALPLPHVISVVLVLILVAVLGFYSAFLRRKAAEVRESADLLRTVVEFAPEGIIIIDAETQHFMDANQNALRLFGVDRGNLLRGGPIDLCPALQPGGRSSRAVMEEKLREAMSGKTPVFEWTCRSSAGKTISCEVHLVRLPGPESSRIRGSIIDITERKRIENMKNDFVSTVSHELRTPITAIRGSLGLLANGVAGALPGSAQSMIDVAHKNCERLVRLVNDILDIEKVDAGKMSFNLKSVRLHTVVGRATILNRPFAQGRNVELRFQSDEHGALVFGDEDRLMQVLTNLISNAVKASPRGGEVAIGISHKGAHWRTTIQDRGPGIPEDFRSKLFQKFVQADKRDDSTTRKGTGLGLAIAKALVEKMGGTIGFETETGQGTTFFFDLAEDSRALARPDGNPSPEASAPASPVSAG